MAQAKKAKKVKLFCGLIARKEYLKPAITALEKKFGAADFQSNLFEFTHTNYYYKEMGEPLYRQFISFKKLISPESLWKIKIRTNKLERFFSRQNKRGVNIDPGYLALPKVILASAKNFAHRIYLNKGIYAEVTLLYQNGDYKPLEWTFPDYKTETHYELFKRIRALYEKQIKRKNTD